MHAAEPLNAPRRSPADTGRRLLLVSYHFPPGQAAGALRWEKLAVFAAERGWGLDVVTAHPDDLPSADPGRLARLPEGTLVFGVRASPGRLGAWEGAARALARRVLPERRAETARGSAEGGPPNEAAEAALAWRRELRWSATPAGARRAFRAWRAFEEEGAWARAAERAAAELLDARHAAVVTCGPPHMAHLAGRGAAARAGLPLVVDLRDPWSLAPAVFRDVGSPLWYALAERYERRAVDAAALVVCNTGALAAQMARLHPGARGRIVTVMNGCDDEPLPPRREERRFVVAYAGSIYIDRDPRPLLRAAARVVREAGAAPDRFAIEVVGHADRFGGVSLLRLAEEAGLGGFVAVHPRRPRAEALAMLAGASVLLSLPQGVEVAIPSKLFEYMRFPAWILALAAPGSATAALLEGTDADVVRPDDEDAIARALAARFRQWARGERPRPLDAGGRFGRRGQAEVLLDALEARVGAAERRGRAA